MALYFALASLLVCIWLPIRKPTPRWEMYIYGMPLSIDRSLVSRDHWSRLSYAWRRRDVT